jgi:HEAT repeat protein
LQGELCDPKIELRKKAVNIVPLLGTRAERAMPTLRKLAFLEQDSDLRAKAQASLMLVLPIVVDVPDSIPEAQVAIPDLLAGLPSAHSVEVLALIGPAARIAIPRLLGIMKDKSGYEEVKVAAARALGRIGRGDEAVTAELQEVLRSATDSHVRGVVARALGELKCVACIKALRRFLEDEDSWIQEDAAYALGKIGPAAREAIPELSRLLASPDESLKFQAALALWQITHESERLLPHLATSIGRYWNLEAVEAAAEIGPAAQDAVPMIADLLWTESSLTAARALAKIGRASVPRLVQALREEGWYPRANAAWALGDIGPDARDAIPALEALAGDVDQDEEVSRAAAEALAKIRR